MSVLKNHMRENTRALNLTEKERDEAIKQLGSLETQKRQLEEELQPLERKKRQLETQIEVSKKRVSTNEITTMIMRQEDPVGCLEEVAGRFGRRLEKPLVLKTEEEVTTPLASSSASAFEGKRPVRIVRRRGTRPVDSYLVIDEAKLRRQRLSAAEEEALRASIAPTPSQNHSDTKQAASDEYTDLDNDLATYFRKTDTTIVENLGVDRPKPSADINQHLTIAHRGNDEVEMKVAIKQVSIEAAEGEKLRTDACSQHWLTKEARLVGKCNSYERFKDHLEEKNTKAELTLDEDNAIILEDTERVRKGVSYVEIGANSSFVEASARIGKTAQLEADEAQSRLEVERRRHGDDSWAGELEDCRKDMDDSKDSWRTCVGVALRNTGVSVSEAFTDSSECDGCWWQHLKASECKRKSLASASNLQDFIHK
ncbi:hypothetical protein SLS56_009106 [Neofusicoccum ribis]|uniref:Uncharacterized protein n=1 Tax=Neofusicoccum ribis TaxID=45134 RepID=A0ABR3SI56_9PEZI